MTREQAVTRLGTFILTSQEAWTKVEDPYHSAYQILKFIENELKMVPPMQEIPEYQFQAEHKWEVK